MSKYQKRHYEDVARLVKESWPEAVPEDVNEVILFSLANRFADLLAADNPRVCRVCGSSGRGGRFCFGASGRVTRSTDPHIFSDGFDRERFLKACGLEPPRPYSTSQLAATSDPEDIPPAEDEQLDRSEPCG